MRNWNQWLAGLGVVLLLAGCLDGPATVLEPGDPLPPAELEATQGWVPGTPALVADGLLGTIGSTIGPDGALYVPEGAVGRISRVDLGTGDVTTFATGLPPAIIPIWGVVDVAFIGGTAYALVTLVGPEFGGGDVVGVYRIDGPASHTVVGDIGAFNQAHPPEIDFEFDFPTGLQYAIEVYRGGFLVTDGHLNRVLRVTTDGEVSLFRQFDNTVPTGLEVRGSTVYMAEAGPAPHEPEDGRILAFGPRSSGADVVAVGAPLLVDVRFGRGSALFGLSQGEWDQAFPGSAAIADAGSIVKVRGDGSFDTVVHGLDRPTSFQVVGNDAYVVTLTGQVWKVANVSGPPFGRTH